MPVLFELDVWNSVRVTCRFLTYLKGLLPDCSDWLGDRLSEVSWLYQMSFICILETTVLLVLCSFTMGFEHITPQFILAMTISGKLEVIPYSEVLLIWILCLFIEITFADYNINI